MDSTVEKKSGARIISGSVLKLIALFTMMFDHTAKYLLIKIPECTTPFLVIFDQTFSVYSIMLFFGRFAFPIYCFLITEGYIHTHDRKKYGLSLLLFAVISEIPWNLEHCNALLYESQNVFFTLFLGYTAICIHEKFKDETNKQIFGMAVVFAVCIVINADYGVLGAALILVMYALRGHKAAQAFIGAGMMSQPIPCALAFVPINMYNGERGFIRGKIFKYLFYALYPGHILLIWYLRRTFFGY